MNEFSAAAHWARGYDEAGLQQWASQLRQRLAGPVSLGLVFISPKLFPHARQILEILRVHAQIPLLAGCSSQGLIAGQQELEQDGGFTAALYSLPGAQLEGFHLVQEQVEEANGGAYWHLETGIEPSQVNGWLAFAEPLRFEAESWLRSWNTAYPGQPVLGGLASGDAGEAKMQVYLNGDVFEEGVVAVSVGGAVRLAGVISQGCTPIGETWTLTRVDQHIIHEIGNRPAYEVLVETFKNLPAEQQRKAQGNLFIGLVVNEYLEDFHRGDFLIRNLLGADPRTGSLAVNALPRAGQTVQFQRRDAAAATEDMTELLGRARKELGAVPIYGACLCCCNGRGRGLFGQPNHDAELVQQQLGPIGLAGFFCNGEIGPIGERNFLHGFTASLALFVGKKG
ncbi:MAG: FIST N-terminal domain-containing protein [Verrucomicrobiota bacterium]